MFPFSYSWDFSKICEIYRICKFLGICGFHAFCVRCILRVFSQKTHICIKVCIFIENADFCKNLYTPFFCEFWPSIFHKKNIATPKKTTYFARSAQKWRAQKMGVNELRYLADIFVKIMFWACVSSIICTLNLELVIYDLGDAQWNFVKKTLKNFLGALRVQ